MSGYGFSTDRRHHVDLSLEKLELMLKVYSVIQNSEQARDVKHEDKK
jgi:hypothetical protein